MPPNDPARTPRQARPRAGLRRWRAARAGLGAAALLAGALALAQGAGQQCDNPARSADELLVYLPRCQNNAAYLARLGQLFNAEQRYQEAADHLERAILFNPDDTAPQMAYAIALAGSGDTLSALQLIAALLARPDLPEPQRVSLMAVRAGWAQAAATRVQQTRLQAGLRLGYDNNLLGAPNLSSLTLTFPGEVVHLPLDGSNLPQPGSYLRADARLDHTRIHPDGTRWDASIGLLQRHSQRVRTASSGQAEALIERSHSGPPRGDGLPTMPGHYLNASAALLDTRSGTRYHSLGTAAGLQWNSAPGQGNSCQWRLGAEAQQRSLRSNPLLSGRYYGLAAQWGCSGLASAPQWRLSLRAGRDTPANPQRPGARQAEYALRGLYSQPIASTSAWLTEAELSHTRDASGYSPLLDNGARRRLQRIALRTEIQTTLQPGLSLLAGAEIVGQQSNLPLFDLRSRGAYLGLRASW